MSGNPDCK